MNPVPQGQIGKMHTCITVYPFSGEWRSTVRSAKLERVPVSIEAEYASEAVSKQTSH